MSILSIFTLFSCSSDGNRENNVVQSDKPTGRISFTSPYGNYDGTNEWMYDSGTVKSGTIFCYFTPKRNPDKYVILGLIHRNNDVFFSFELHFNFKTGKATLLNIDTKKALFYYQVDKNVKINFTVKNNKLSGSFTSFESGTNNKVSGVFIDIPFEKSQY